MIIKVILPAKDIPLGSIVTKTKGTAQYILRNRLSVYPVDPGKKERLAREERGDPKPQVQQIEADSGILFLVGFDPGNAGNANAIRSDKELIWHAHPDSLASILGQSDYDWGTACPTCGHDLEESP